MDAAHRCTTASLNDAAVSEKLPLFKVEGVCETSLAPWRRKWRISWHKSTLWYS